MGIKAISYFGAGEFDEPVGHPGRSMRKVDMWVRSSRCNGGYGQITGEQGRNPESQHFLPRREGFAGRTDGRRLKKQLHVTCFGQL